MSRPHKQIGFAIVGPGNMAGSHAQARRKVSG
jgi:hypothetical protein